MSQNTRVFHVARGFSLKHSQVKKAVLDGSLMWVVVGQSFRNATPAESFAARQKQAEESDPLELAELHHLKVVNIPHLYDEYRLTKEANVFAQESAA
jgi:hypothetical protein